MTFTDTFGDTFGEAGGRPEVGPFTERVYGRLPEYLRDDDEAQADGPDGYPLLRFLALVCHQGDELEALVDRMAYLAPVLGAGATVQAEEWASDLVDPERADVAWLPWLGQFVGVELAPGLTEAERRSAVGSTSGWRAGTKASMEAAARTVLTGSRWVQVSAHYGGDPWKVEVRTRPTETPSSAAVLAAVVDARTKPAGVELVHTTYAASWAQLEAAYPTSASWDATGSWLALEETGAP